MSRHGKSHGSPRKREREFKKMQRRVDDERQAKEARQRRQQQRLAEAQAD